MSGRASRLIREGALWGGASVLVLALHLGGALWIMRQAEAAAPPGLPAPVFIDLAPAEEVAEEPAVPTEEPVQEAAEEPVEPEPQPEPEPEEVAEPLDLPPLPQLEPLDDMADLFPPAPPDLDAPPEVVLNTSARPQRRPEREPEPEPQHQAEPRRERREPEPQRQAEPRRQEQPAPRQQQQARRVEQGQQGATGRTGASAQQIARDEASWKQQVGVCLLRSASRVSGASGARSTVALVIARNGRVQSASLTASTGDPRVDREISRAMGRARCPAAPSSLTKAAYQFYQPFAIQ
ncbi:energy transducer TonB [Paracoccus sp. YIM 132242]|uniref:Energy transducer TonB n=1 Tax=Paracoccus lichenicola TaxID=2665644 RepID=A0A6L6HN27_9RHOB|nr:energy transducer TonB [Paracoccus lichenicola]MTE00567.1 energy transducer TonB [Paracoccus lichenicola]